MDSGDTVMRKIFTSKELYIIISSYLLYFLMLSAWSVRLFLIPGNRYSNQIMGLHLHLSYKLRCFFMRKNSYLCKILKKEEMFYAEKNQGIRQVEQKRIGRNVPGYSGDGCRSQHGKQLSCRLVQ